MKLKSILVTFGIIAVIGVIGFAGLEYKKHLDSEEAFKRSLDEARYRIEEQGKKKQYMEEFLTSEKAYSCIYTEKNRKELSRRAASRLMKDRGGAFSIRSINKGLEIEIQTDTTYLYKFEEDREVTKINPLAATIIAEMGRGPAKKFYGGVIPNYDVDQSVYKKERTDSLSIYAMTQRLERNNKYFVSDEEMARNTKIAIEGLDKDSITVIIINVDPGIIYREDPIARLECYRSR